MDTVVEEDHVNNETTDSACGRANNTTILNDTLNDEEDTKMEEKLMGEASDSSNDSGSVGSSETVTMSGDKEETVTTEEVHTHIHVHVHTRTHTCIGACMPMCTLEFQ